MSRANFTGKPTPLDRHKCWAMIPKSHGAMVSSYHNCSRKARSGKLTCTMHDDLEADAQQKKAEYEVLKGKA